MFDPSNNPKAEEYAQSILDVAAVGSDYLERDATYEWVIDVEQPARAKIDQLRSLIDPDYDGTAEFKDFQNDAVR